jgi:hypothetical protein
LFNDHLVNILSNYMLHKRHHTPSRQNKTPSTKTTKTRDVQGIHPLSYAGDGTSFKDPTVSGMIEGYNKKVGGGRY